jgi:hypothetical protein
MTTIRAADLWRLAEAKWAEIAVNTPDLAPALAVQKGLLRLLVDATEAFQIPAGAILWELTPDLVLAKWAREVPAFRHESVVIPSALKGILPLVCDVLADGGAGDSARHIKNALVTGAIDAGSLLSVSFARNQKAIRTSSIHMGLAPDLVWLVGELGSSPLAHRLQATLIAQPELHDAVLDWNRGYCPCCGSWPALVEMLDGARMLRCSYCAAAWELRSYRCIYCGNEDGRFLAAAPDMARKDRGQRPDTVSARRHRRSRQSRSGSRRDEPRLQSSRALRCGRDRSAAASALSLGLRACLQNRPPDLCADCCRAHPS